MTLDPSHVRHLARLAGLRLSDAEVERLSRELSVVLAEIEGLEGVDLSGTAAGGEGAAPPSEELLVRSGDGAPTPDPLSREPSALAPEWRDGFFAMPRPSAFGNEAAFGEDGAPGEAGESRAGEPDRGTPSAPEEGG